MLHRRRPIPRETDFGSMLLVDWRTTPTSYIYTLRCRHCGQEKTAKDAEIRPRTGIPHRIIVDRIRCACVPPQSVETAVKKAIVKSYRNNAKRYHRPFTLTDKAFWALLDQPCFYCGSPPANVATRSQGTYRYNGVDRMDSTGGYTPDNTVPCCWPCNRAKRDRSQADFIAWIDRCYANLHGGTPYAADE